MSYEYKGSYVHENEMKCFGKSQWRLVAQEIRYEKET